jgi:hypothetical protein
MGNVDLAARIGLIVGTAVPGALAEQAAKLSTQS